MQTRRNSNALKKTEEFLKDENIEVWAIDECHFQQHGSRCYMWIPSDVKDPVILRKPTRRSVGYYGAVRLRDGKFVYLREEDRFNAETFFRFIKYLRRLTARSSKKIVVIVDNARYHHALLHKQWREECQGSFRLEFLPPYSPELNPIERVWKLTRRQATHNRYFPYLEVVMMAVEGLFESWRQGSDTLRRLCAIS
jgi:transposase